MIIYDLNSINNLINITDKTLLDTNTIELLNIIMNENVDKNRNLNKSKFTKSKFVENKTTKMVENFNDKRIKIINERPNDEININLVKKLLNKLTENNYDKIKTELICFYNTLISNEYIIAENIFEILSNNKFYSKLNSDLFIELLNVDKIFYDILQTKLENINNIAEKILQNDINLDKIECKLLFYINLSNSKIIEINIIVNIINNLQEKLLSVIKNENNSIIGENLTNIIDIIISNINIKYVKSNYSIYNNIKTISKFKNKDFPSLNNKIIFKHMDMNDLIETNNLI